MEVDMENVRVVIGIDVETDVGSWTPFYESVGKGIPLLLNLFERTGVKTTFFFTGAFSSRASPPGCSRQRQGR